MRIKSEKMYSKKIKLIDKGIIYIKNIFFNKYYLPKEVFTINTN